MKRYYIGLSVSTHDPALAIVDQDGETLFAEATERFLQYKRAPNCEPDNERLVSLLRRHCDQKAQFIVAVNWRRFTARFSRLLSQVGLTSAKAIFKSRSPDVKFNTPYSLRTKITNAYAASMYERLGVGFSYAMKLAFPESRYSIRYYAHHLCHAALACYSSPFSEASCMIVDGAGDFGSFAYYRYQSGAIQAIREQKGFASLGRFYADMTWLCGFNPDKGEEWKVMGFAPYGSLDQKAYELLKSLFVFKGSEIRGISSRAYQNILKQLQERLAANTLESRNLAFTAQQVFSETLIEAIRTFHRTCPSDNLAMAGGCLLNSSAAGLIEEQTPFKRLFVPSAPADDGTALGAALLALHRDHPRRHPDKRNGSPYLGSEISKKKLERVVQVSNTPNLRHFPGTIHIETAKLLSDGKLVGWVQGRAEFGPRSLGNRSILADPRPATMKDKINARVKFREEFRPFAPSILYEFGPEYFENYQESPYMERTLRFREQVWTKVPAVVHVNGTGRLQTVKPEYNEKFYALIRAFYELTGIPILLNTSFNVMGKPIIHSIEDAMSVFYSSGLDVLVIHDFLIRK
ncbi:MAG: nodulation protein nolNO [Methylococcaceae bacterium]|nr:nodulation protein nolNO [Methylococcaceae bacterium]MCI0734630.1 nodulation protein nolNO [Methylococcaceae bacterium]